MKKVTLKYSKGNEINDRQVERVVKGEISINDVV